MTNKKLFDTHDTIPLQIKSPEDELNTLKGQPTAPENWYAEPFTKRTGCRTPGQCGGACDCGCPYNTMSELDRLPLIEDIARIFPDEWLAFIISADEDEDLEPVHGKLIAHSPNPDDVSDAVNTVLWNQHVYVFFNGDFERLKDSYGQAWRQEIEAPTQRTFSGPTQINDIAAEPPDQAPENHVDLVYSAIDQLYGQPNLNEAIRRLRLARVKAARADDQTLIPIIDNALDQLEAPLPRINEITWFLEEALVELVAM